MVLSFAVMLIHMDLATGGAEGIRLNDMFNNLGNEGIEPGSELAEFIRFRFFVSNDSFDFLDMPTAVL